MMIASAFLVYWIKLLGKAVLAYQYAKVSTFTFFLGALPLK